MKHVRDRVCIEVLDLAHRAKLTRGARVIESAQGFVDRTRSERRRDVVRHKKFEHEHLELAYNVGARPGESGIALKRI